MSTATATTASASTASERRVTREGVAITSDQGAVTLSLYLILLKYLFTIVQKYTVKLSTQMFK